MGGDGRDLHNILEEEYDFIEKELRDSGYNNPIKRNYEEKVLRIQVTNDLEPLYIFDRVSREKINSHPTDEIRLEFHYPIVKRYEHFLRLSFS